MAQQVYDARGRYADKTLNHYGQVTQEIMSRNGLGLPHANKNAQGVIGNIEYDHFGREVYRLDQTGAEKQTNYMICNSNCPTGATYYVQTLVTGGGESIQYMDALGRTLQEKPKPLMVVGSWWICVMIISVA